MIKAYLFDFSRVILFPRDKNYSGELNALHKELSGEPDYDFWEHFYLDEDLLGYLRSIKGRYHIYMFTSGFIQNAPEVKPLLEEVFEKIYSAEEIHMSKKDPKAYDYIAEDIGLTPDEISFVDDSEENVKAAKAAGCSAITYKELDDLKQKIKAVLERN